MAKETSRDLLFLMYKSLLLHPMSTRPGEYREILAGASNLDWSHVKGEPEGVTESFLHKHEDGSYTHLVRVEGGTELPNPVSHVFYEEAFYIQGEMLNTKTGETIRGGAYVFHEPGEVHGPFRCLKTCLILEFRYFKSPARSIP